MNRPGAKVAILSSVHEALDPRILHKQARTLAATGFAVHLLASYSQDELRDGVRIHALPEPSSRWSRPAQWARLAVRTWRLRPDIIHIHDPELLPLLLLLRPLLGAAAVYDAHEYYGEEIARRAWIPAPLRRPAAWLTEQIETFVARRIDAVVAVNEHMAARFRRRGARAIAVHNFPPVEYFDRPNPPSPFPTREGGEPNPAVTPLPHQVARSDSDGAMGERAALVGYVGLLSPDRGLSTVYTAARLLRQRCPAARVRVIGRVDWSGLPVGIPREPAAWAEAGVEFAGTIPADTVPAALRALAVGWVPFLDTANNRRTIPLKLLEYMAAGLPVVASAIGYIARIVADSGCGLLVPPGDAAAHAAALAALLADPERAGAMGAAGRTAVRERYTWAAEGEKLVGLYNRLLAERRRA